MSTRKKVTLAKYFLLVPALTLVGLTVNLLFSSSPRCEIVYNRHARLIASTLALRELNTTTEKNKATAVSSTGLRLTAVTIPHKRTAQFITRVLRAGTRLLRARRDRDCLERRISRSAALSLEFSVTSRYAADGVLLYLLALVGTTTKTAVELDSASANGAAGVCSMFAHAPWWHVYSLHESWSAFEATRVRYDGLRNAVAVDAGRIFPLRDQIIAAEHFGGRVDVASVLLDGGEDVHILRSFAEPASWLRPRLVLIFFQDYWGLANRVRVSSDGKPLSDGVSDGRDLFRKRLFTGGSLTALIRIAQSAGYRLVWCLHRTPIAVFADEQQGVGDGILQTVNPSRCFHIRKRDLRWRRDAEAMWDDAHSFKWNSTE